MGPNGQSLALHLVFLKPGSYCISYREETSLRHVAMVAKYLDDNKPKMHLKSNSHCFKLHRSYSIQLICQMLVTFPEVESGRTVFK